jgi:hypothetical protein
VTTPGAPTTCPACRQVIDRPARYCYHCGLWLIGVSAEGQLAAAPTSAGPAGACPQCQYLSPYNSNFCANCGYRLNQNPLTKKEAQQRAAQAAYDAKTPEEREKSKLRANNIGLIVGVVLFLVATTLPFALPSSHSYYLLPLAVPVLSGIGVCQQKAKRAKARLAQIRQESGPAHPAST